MINRVMTLWLTRHLIPGMMFVFLVTLCLYLLTMPRTITLEDAGLFQMICHNGGIGHPPGYPLFIVSCQAFVNLPVFDQGVFAGNLMSAIFASAACAVLVVVLQQLQMPYQLSVALALVYGLSVTFWSQSIIVEVYSLAVLLFLVCLSLCLAYQKTGQGKYLFWLALFFGLALSNHWPLQGLGTPALLVVLAPRLWSAVQFSVKPLNLLGLLLLLGVGLTPYLTLFQASPAFAVYGGIESGMDFLKYVTRQAYVDQGELAGIGDKFAFQQWLAEQTLRELTVPLGLLAGLGLVLSFRQLPLHLSIALVLLYLSATSILNLMLGFEFNDHRVAIFQPYPVISYLALVIWLGIAVTWLFMLASPLLVKLAPVFLVAVTLVGNFPGIGNRDNNFAEAYGELLLDSIPEDAVLFVEGDVGVGVVGYLHHVRKQRPDVELRSWNNLVFENRLTSPYSSLEQQNNARRAYIRATENPVFSITAQGEPGLESGLLFRHKVEPGYECNQRLHGYIRELVAVDQLDILTNGHEKELLFGLLLAFSRTHIGLVSDGSLTDEQHSEELATLVLLERSFAGKLALLESQLGSPAGKKDQLVRLVEAAAEQMPEGANTRIKALLAEYRGRIALITPDNPEQAMRHLERALDLNALPGNSSVCPLHETYLQLGLETKASDLLGRFDDASCRQAAIGRQTSDH